MAKFPIFEVQKLSPKNGLKNGPAVIDLCLWSIKQGPFSGPETRTAFWPHFSNFSLLIAHPRTPRRDLKMQGPDPRAQRLGTRVRDPETWAEAMAMSAATGAAAARAVNQETTCVSLQFPSPL